MSVSATHAVTVTYALDYEFSGATAPGGAAPWLTATFEDYGGTGSVDLTLETTNLINAESVQRWLFNFDPAFDLANLAFSQTGSTGTFTDPTYATGVDVFKADGDGYFDICFDFVAQDGPDIRFGGGGIVESVVFTITSSDPITAYSFDFPSAPDGSPGVFPTAAHVVSTGDGEDSGWVSIPEPTTLTLLVLGSLVILRRRS
jgi:hypothetical protein